MPAVKVGDINMYYEIHGKGEPLVMICGASATVEMYAPANPYFANDFGEEPHKKALEFLKKHSSQKA
jgi:hypothetical protein